MRKGLKKFIALLIAEFFYCGLSPFAPGTVGSLGSLAIWVPSAYFAWPPVIKLTLLAVLFFLGIWASTYAINYYGSVDPKQVVIDEVVGQGVPFLAIDSLSVEIILAFLFFRFFDILKPWPIRWIELRFPNQWGLMLDDVMAGACALTLIVFFSGLRSILLG